MSEQRYAELEAGHEQRRAATARRGPVSLVVVMLGVALVVGVVAAVDLRRLQSPQGTALAWSGAALFGDCRQYLALSVADPGAPVRDRRTEDVLCADLRRLTAQARQDPEVGADALSVREGADAAVVRLAVTRVGGRESEVDVPLVPDGDGGWLVVRTAEVCRAVGCA